MATHACASALELKNKKMLIAEKSSVQYNTSNKMREKVGELKHKMSLSDLVKCRQGVWKWYSSLYKEQEDWDRKDLLF